MVALMVLVLLVGCKGWEASDLDGDGIVGLGDLEVLIANWGEVGLLTEALDGDAGFAGIVGESDLAIGRAPWGTGGTGGSAVPEPGTLAGMTLLALLKSGRSRRHGSSTTTHLQIETD